MQVYIVLILIFAIVITLFALFNSVIVPVSLLFFEVEMSLALVIIISTLVGAILITLIDMVRKVRNVKEKKGLQKKATELEKQIALKEEALSQRDQLILQKDALIDSQRKTIEEMDTNVANALNKTNEMVEQ